MAPRERAKNKHSTDWESLDLTFRSESREKVKWWLSMESILKMNDWQDYMKFTTWNVAGLRSCVKKGGKNTIFRLYSSSWLFSFRCWISSPWNARCFVLARDEGDWGRVTGGDPPSGISSSNRNTMLSSANHNKTGRCSWWYCFLKLLLRDNL